MAHGSESDSGPAIGDGAYGTLLANDIHGGEIPDTLCLRAPLTVSDAHTRYVEAGATVIETNTFMAWSLPGPRRRELYLTALELARAAVESSELTVIAAVGPAGRTPRDFYADLELLLDAEVQGVRCETVTDVDTARAFARAWDEVSGGAPAIATLSLSIAPTGGTERWRWITTLDGNDTLRLGLNCCEGPAGLRDPLTVLAERSEPLGIELAPSAGLPEFANGGVIHPWRPADWAAAVAELCVDLPVTMVGGCCGTTPDHIAALADVIAA